jgi:hypothetical protein
LNGSELEIVNEFNYLGILFNRTGISSMQFETVSKPLRLAFSKKHL